MTFGLDPVLGFVPKTAADIESDIDAGMRANPVIGANVDLSPDQPLGQMKALVAGVAAEMWATVAAIYQGLDPDSIASAGFILDGTAAITGTKRTGPTASAVRVDLSLNANTSVPVGATINVSTDVTNTWTLVGTSDPTTGLLVTAGPVSSGTSAGTFPAFFESTSTGPNVAAAGTLTSITNTISGWTAANNPHDATLGADRETDDDLRTKRRNELAAAGGATVPGLESDLLAVPGVVSVDLQENTGDVTDANGLPPHSLQVTVFDGTGHDADDTAIANAIAKDRPSGSRTVGATSVTVTDANGSALVISFSRAAVTPFYVSLALATDGTYAGAAAVKSALVSYWASVAGLSVPVPIDDLRASLTLAFSPFKVQGITKVTSISVGTTASPTGTADLPPIVDGLYSLDTSNIVVS